MESASLDLVDLVDLVEEDSVEKVLAFLDQVDQVDMAAEESEEKVVAFLDLVGLVEMGMEWVSVEVYLVKALDSKVRVSHLTPNYLYFLQQIHQQIHLVFPEQGNQ